MKYIKRITAMSFVAVMLVSTSGCSLIEHEKKVNSSVRLDEYTRPEFEEAIVQYGVLDDDKVLTLEYQADGTKDYKFGLTGVFETLDVSVGEEIEAGTVIATLKCDDITEAISDCEEEINLLQAKITHLSNSVGLATSSDALAETNQELKYAREDLGIAQLRLHELNNEKSRYVLKADQSGVVTYIISSEECTYYGVTPASLIATVESGEKLFSGSVKSEVDFTVGDTENLVIDNQDYEVEITNLVYEDGKTYVEAKPTDNSIVLESGDRGKIEIDNGSDEEVLYVDYSAVFYAQEKPYVYIYDKNGYLAATPVECGEVVGGNVTIKSGLEEGDKVVIY